MFMSLFTRLFTTYLFVTLISLFVVAIFLFEAFEEVYFSSKVEELKKQGNQLSKIIEEHFEEEKDINAIYEELTMVDGFLEANIWIIDHEGEVIAYTPRRSFREEFIICPDKKGKVLNNENVVGRGLHPSFDDEMLTVGVPVTNKGDNTKKEVKGAVFIHSPVVGFTATIGKKRQFIFYAGGLAIICSVVAAFFLSKSISDPLYRINRAALNMADGDLNQRVPVETKDEVGQLSQSFNYLGDILQNTIGELNEEKNKLESILQSMGEGVIAVDNDFNILMANNQAYEVLNSSFNGGTVNDYELQEYFTRVIKSGETLEEELNVAGNRLIVLVVTPLYGAQDKIWGCVGALRDITELRKLENVRRDFVANVSHELRTPLTSIKGFLEALVDGVVEEEDTKKRYYKTMLEETIRLDRLINNLLDLSKIESGKIEWKFSSIDLSSLVCDVSDKLTPQLVKKEIKLINEIPAGLPGIKADYDRISQVLINLIDNAINFTGPGGKIIIGAEYLHEQEMVKVWVKDEGEGIPAEELNNIWHRFHKVEKSRSKSYKTPGTGLGLSIVKHIVENHGGWVNVDSKYGEGTVFTFTLALK